MRTSRKLLLFLHKLAARHVSEFGLLAKGLLALADGKNESISSVYVPDDKMKLAAHLLCVLGQDSEEDRASMVAKTCTIAIETARDSQEELSQQLVEAIEALATDDVEAVQRSNIEALQAEFAGTQVEIVSRGGRDFYTFKGRAAYPAELTYDDKKFQLCNASYRKGTYQLVK